MMRPPDQTLSKAKTQLGASNSFLLSAHTKVQHASDHSSVPFTAAYTAVPQGLPQWKLVNSNLKESSKKRESVPEQLTTAKKRVSFNLPGRPDVATFTPRPLVAMDNYSQPSSDRSGSNRQKLSGDASTVLNKTRTTGPPKNSNSRHISAISPIKTASSKTGYMQQSHGKPAVNDHAKNLQIKDLIAENAQLKEELHETVELLTQANTRINECKCKVLRLGNRRR